MKAQPTACFISVILQMCTRGLIISRRPHKGLCLSDSRSRCSNPAGRCSIGSRPAICGTSTGSPNRTVTSPCTATCVSPTGMRARRNIPRQTRLHVIVNDIAYILPSTVRFGYRSPVHAGRHSDRGHLSSATSVPVLDGGGEGNTHPSHCQRRHRMVWASIGSRGPQQAGARISRVRRPISVSSYADSAPSVFDGVTRSVSGPW